MKMQVLIIYHTVYGNAVILVNYIDEVVHEHR